ncbi:MAG: ankyrin repeat domain-containing protein [Mariprofundaceae bacterium]
MDKSIIRLISLMVLLLLAISPINAGEIYSYIDKYGKKVFTQNKLLSNKNASGAVTVHDDHSALERQFIFKAYIDKNVTVSKVTTNILKRPQHESGRVFARLNVYVQNKRKKAVRLSMSLQHHDKNLKTVVKLDENKNLVPNDFIITGVIQKLESVVIHYNIEMWLKNFNSIHGWKVTTASTQLNPKKSDTEDNSHVVPLMGVVGSQIKVLPDDTYFTAFESLERENRRKDEARALKEQKKHQKRKATNNNNIIAYQKFKASAGGENRLKNLCSTIQQGTLEQVKAQIATGVNLSMPWESKFPLMYAAERGDKAIIKTLLFSGASPNSVDNAGNIALIYAAKSGNSDAVKTLVQYTKFIDHPNKERRTALMHATIINSLKSVKTLITANADVTLKDKHGNTARMLAAKYNHTKINVYLYDAEEKKR